MNCNVPIAAPAQPLHSEWYRTVNWVLLGLSLYAVLLPFISPSLAKVLPPALTTCWYHARTGKPCPFCGITRDFRRFTAGDFVQAKRFNALSLPLFLLCLFELGWRIALLWGLAKSKPLLCLIGLDLLWHLAVAVALAFLYFSAFSSS